MLTFLQVPFDYLILILSAWTAYAVRFSEPVRSLRPALFTLNLDSYALTVCIVAALWVVIFALSGLYSTDPNRKFAQEFGRIILACSTGFAAITIYIFFSLQRFDSRFLVLGGSILATLFITLGRLAVLGIKRSCYRAGYNLRRTVIVGSSPIAALLTETLTTERQLGYLVVDTIDYHTTRDHKRIIEAHPDEIIVSDPKLHPEETLELIDIANEHSIVFKYTADLFATIASNITIATINGIPIVEVRQTKLSGWGSLIKRLVDICGSTLLLILTSPLMIITALLVLIETGRPIFYKNERVGQQGKKFFALKFRSMYQKDCTGEQFGASGEAALRRESELIKTQSIKTGPIYKIKDDPRVTPLGRIIRRLSIDELPQLINVLCGSMSLVGPRPHQPREVNHYKKHHRIVLAIKPGITGLAQISGRSNLSFEEEIKLDSLYIEHWRLLTDFIILIKTPFVVIKKEGVL